MLCLGLGPGFPRRELESPTSRSLRQRGRWPGKVPGEGNGFQHPRHKHGPFDSQSSPQSGPQLKDSLATQVCKIQESLNLLLFKLASYFKMIRNKSTSIEKK